MRSSEKDSTAKQLQLMLKATEIRLRRAKPDHVGLVSSGGEGTLSVQVSPANIARAMGVLRRLAEHLASRGIVLDPVNGSASEGRAARWSSSVLIDGCRIFFRLREAWKLVPYEWTAADRRTFDRSGYAPHQRTSRKPTGELCFVIDGYDQAKSIWRDGKRRGLLEEQVPAFVDGLVVVAAERREREASRRQRDAEYRERAEKEREATRVLGEKRRRFELLLQEATAWRHVQDVREFISALRAAASERLDTEAVGRVERWASNAISLATEWDPVLRALEDAAKPEVADG